MVCACDELYYIAACNPLVFPARWTHIGRSHAVGVGPSPQPHLRKTKSETKIKQRQIQKRETNMTPTEMNKGRRARARDVPTGNNGQSQAGLKNEVVARMAMHGSDGDLLFFPISSQSPALLREVSRCLPT